MSRKKEQPKADRLVAMLRDPADGTRRDGERELPLGERARSTRAALLGAAWVEFAERGYRGTQPADIAARAGVSAGTFYQYFRSRSDVMAHLVSGALRDQLADEGHVWHVDQGEDGLRVLVRSHISTYASSAAFQKAWEEATHADDELAEVRRALSRWLDEAVEAAMRRGVRDGFLQVADGVDLALAARLFNGMLDRYCYRTFVFDPPDPAPSLEASVDTIIAVWSAALGLGRSEG